MNKPTAMWMISGTLAMAWLLAIGKADRSIFGQAIRSTALDLMLFISAITQAALKSSASYTAEWMWIDTFRFELMR